MELHETDFFPSRMTKKLRQVTKAFFVQFSDPVRATFINDINSKDEEGRETRGRFALFHAKDSTNKSQYKKWCLRDEDPKKSQDKGSELLEFEIAIWIHEQTYCEYISPIVRWISMLIFSARWLRI